MEIESLEALTDFNFKILDADSSAASIECSEEEALRLISRVGGSFKIAKVLSNNVSSAFEGLALPFDEKFGWTVSGYDCPPALLQEARERLHDLLQSRGLGRSKFLKPDIVRQDKQERILVSELKSSAVHSKILFPENGRKGLDLVIHGKIGGKVVYAQTVGISDFRGFEERDFLRPHQEPRKTISPRIARVLTNLAVNSQTRTILDPFAGLGTILQEALVSGYSVVGVDRDQENIEKSKENLRWTADYYKIRRFQMNLFAYDARRLSRARMPEIDAIASEPILLPAFKTNPSPEDAKLSLEKAEAVYNRCMREFSSVILKGGRIAITTPVVIDSSGKRRTFSLEGIAASAGLKQYRGKFTSRTKFPLEVETTRKRIVQRAISVYCLT